MQHIDGWLDLCSGVGAGFPYAGIKLWERSPDYFCEWNNYCNSILRRRYPEVQQRFSNIKALDFKSEFDNEVQLITASPPCQPFSVDGKRLAATDTRNCIPDVLRAIRELQPQFAIIENVAGLLNCPYSPGDKAGSYFSYILDSLSSCGYDAEWHCVGSDEFASPWRRQRLLIIAIARSTKLEWSEITPWQKQIRESVSGVRIDFNAGSRGPGIPRNWLSTPDRIYEPARESNGSRTITADRPQIGVASRDSDNRDRREALGNCLDWRVAAVGLKRVNYLSQLASEHRSADKI